MRIKKLRVFSICRKILFFIIIFSFIFIGGAIEYKIHREDQYEILKDRFALKYLLASFIPMKNQVNLNNYKLQLPYGYILVNENSAVGIIGSPKKMYEDLNNRFHFFDQLGSSIVWMDNDKMIVINRIRRFHVNYLYFFVRDISK